MNKIKFLALLGSIICLSGCVTKELRAPSASHFLNLNSYVNVPGPNLSEAELAIYKKQCRIQMVEKLLNTSDRLREISNYSQKNIKVGELIHSTYLDLLATWADEYRYFNFTLQDRYGVQYAGHIYTSRVKKEPELHMFNGAYQYQCRFENTKRDLIVKDPFYNPAELRSANEGMVFSSSCAERMYNGEKIDERCRKTE